MVMQRTLQDTAVMPPGSAALGCPRVPTRIRLQAGFTLVELMITLVIAVVLIAIAVPSFRSITLSTKLTSTANDFVASIETARMEAIKRNVSVQVCSNVAANNGSDAMGSACATHAGAVYAGTTAVRHELTIPASLKISGGMPALRFNSTGLAHGVTDTAPASVTVVDICTSGMSSKNHRLIKIQTGSIVTTSTTDGTCS